MLARPFSDRLGGGAALAAIAVLANLALLFVFKYLNFATDVVTSLLGAAGVTLKARHFSLILPLGISFYVFQSISYVIDVYRGTVKAEHSLLCYALYVCFFPQLLQGPIERAGDLMVQFRRSCPFDYARVASGLKLFAFGLFKKACVADKLAVYVNYVWRDVGMSSGCCLLLATFFFAVQIYADFSGYTDMAAGAARILGFDLTANFDHPYFSRTVAEFWRRWHITLGSWFRDYLFYPLLRKLSGSLGKALKRRVSKAAAKNVPTVLALAVVWCATGLWHGANLTFICGTAFLSSLRRLPAKSALILRRRYTSAGTRRGLWHSRPCARSSSCAQATCSFAQRIWRTHSPSSPSSRTSPVRSQASCRRWRGR